MITDPMTVFRQFGFRESHRTEDQVFGLCPFCGKEGHFGIHISGKMWDCKRCARSGGYKKFLEQLIDLGKKNFTGEAVKALVTNRGIQESTFKKMEVGWLPIAESHILPVYAKDGKTILNIKIFGEDGMKNTAGSFAAMYGLWLLPEQYETVFIAEGEWDTLVLMEIVAKLKLKGVAVLGVPGAGTFKPEVLPFLTGKNMYLFYDNDLAGENGKLKAAQLLAGVTGKIHVIKWPKETKEGYDVRDVYKKEKADALKTIEYLKSLCTLYNITSSTTIQADIETVKGEKVPVQEVYGLFKKHLHLPDTEVLDIVFGTVLGNRIPGDPIWMFVVGPPGSTKTVPLIALTGCPRIHAWTGITPHVLISGMNLQGGIDPSLIPQLNEGIWVDKDFTSIIGLPSAEQNEIFSILRDAYDGECSKPFGNGMRRRIKSRFGILAAVTNIIEQFTEEHSALGERFLRWDNKLPVSLKERRPYVERAFDNSGKEPEIQADFNNMAKRILLAEYDMNEIKIPDEMRKKIIDIAMWIAQLRGTVSRDKFSRDKDIIFKSFSELGTRLSKELKKLAKGIAAFRGVKIVDESIFKVLLNVARSSIQTRYDDVMEVVYKKELATVAETLAIGLPRNTVEFVFENLVMLHAIEKDIKNTTPLYRIKPEILEIINSCGIYSR